jgi:Nucleotidyl transferase AbiEii toxin, Type IV TA system
MSFTDPQRVRNYQRRSLLPRRQVLLLLARCGLVRYLAQHHYDRFVLKGGALLYHVYQSNRVSFVDTDFADTETHVPDPDEVERVLTIKSTDGFELTTTPDGRWEDKGNIVKGSRLRFTIQDLQVSDEGHEGRVNISVSFRPGERIITPKEDLYFDAEGLLIDDAPFKVNGLVLDEVAAEKVIGWCVKEELHKHLADLALLARDHRDELDRARVADLIAQKFELEREAMETRVAYERLGLKVPADLNRYFLETKRLEAVHSTWKGQLGTSIWVRREERNEDVSITDPANVESLVREYWADIVAGLPT